ncbi:HEAT repeat domain-containing protein [Leptolyngbya boryana CZ1]|uniref:HEAT repeat domain-containing protein n=1 Tax=Leptolyngbya boryana CZ1 TaxID=3060204 RepID=A0AA96WXG7_LEPBY|nr:HEAT repeat domain-containing protein [Leptolyngbya boryana]WNZ47505.1 HEAT repeat domain-containing protein [Leptolyngbya boryana CZ1]
MTFDFQSYLASIRTTYAKWWEYYTLTDATGKQRQAREDSPFFDFGLMVQTVKREERDRPTEEKVERFSVLDGLRKYADQQVLLVGRPGSGKSTALARLMLEEATDQQARIPVLVELRYWQGSIEQLIRDSLIRHDMPAEQVEAALKNALILFDGVNELPSEEARSQLSAFRRNHPKLPMIFTTRDLSIGGDLGIEKKLEMQPLSEDQMREFVRSYLPDQADQMLRQLKDRLREFGQTPLLLWMLCSLFQQTGTIPENLGLVFREFTQGYEQYLKEDVQIESDKAWWKPVLQQLAWVMMQGEKPTEFRVAIGFEEAVGAIGQFLDQKVPYAEDFARKCLRDLQKHHLIQMGTNQEELEFRHQLIQEYYVAECLLKQLPALSDDEIQQNYLNYLNKTEPLALMLALVQDEALAIRVVRLALEVDRVLGARLAGEVKLEFQKETVGFIETLEVPNWLKIRLLGRTRSEILIPRLFKLLKNSDDEIRENAAYILGKIGAEVAIPELLKRLKDDDYLVRKSVAFALGEIGTESAIPGLLKLLQDKDWRVRESAVSALGEISIEAAIPELFKLLEDNNPDVRESAVSALGEIGTEAAIPELLKLLEDNDDSVRSNAASALGKIGAEAAVPKLLQLLKNDNLKVRSTAASVLGKIAASAAIPGLLKLLQDSDWGVRSNAASALGKIGAEAAIPGLLKLLQDDNFRVRAYAAVALGEIGTEAATLRLLQLLKEDNNLEVSRTVASVLGKIGTEAVIPELLKLLEYDDWVARSSAVSVLGKIGTEAVIPELLKLLEDNDYYARSNVASALGEIGTEAVIPELLKLLQDKDHKVLQSVATALGEIGTEAAIPGLLELLQSENHGVPRRAAYALGKIGTKAIIPELLKLLEEDYYIVREDIAFILSNIAKRHPDHIAPYLPHLLTLIPTQSGGDTYGVILAIQKSCKFYNYEIYQAHLEAQKHDRQTPQNSDLSSPKINQFPNVTEVKIFENVDRYYETPPKDPPS